jgi:hypothetical protein
MGGSAGAGGMGGSAGAGGMGGSAGAGGMGGSAGAGGMGGTGGIPAAATSCLDLLNDGTTTDGTYTVEVNGSPLLVYCDMTTDGGGWTQLLDQDVNVAPGYASTGAWSTGINVDQPNMGHYSILNLISEFEGASAGYEFLVDWPADGGSFIQWTQSQNPFVGRGVVAVIAEAPINQTGCEDTAFAGLASRDGTATLDGDPPAGCWWWAIGTPFPWNGGIPAYKDSAAGLLAASRARLWVR